MQNQIIFEHPLNERMRTFLRVDYLFQLVKYRYEHSSQFWEARECVTNIIELHNFIERTELRHELNKELERHINNFQRLAKTPNVDQQALNKILAQLEKALDSLKQFFEKQSHLPRENDLFNSIRQRINIPGGACSFDLPGFHYWLHLPNNVRQHYMTQWYQALTPIDAALTLVLNLIRDSSNPKEELAENGTFQKSLSTQTPCQLIQIMIDPNLGIYPEISGNKHRINIRFVQADFEQPKPMLFTEEFPFQLNCCMI